MNANDRIRIEIRQGDPGTPAATTVILNGKNVTDTVFHIDLVMRDALEPGAPCDRAFVNRVPYPVNVRHGPKVRRDRSRVDLKPGDLIVVAETPPTGSYRP